jgi:hypothetical protein
MIVLKRPKRHQEDGPPVEELTPFRGKLKIPGLEDGRDDTPLILVSRKITPHLNTRIARKSFKFGLDV